ncbi:MAG: hypothetical protein JW829_07990, partial [Pirellulales bacterium]|nr:hypothetical protein [Pirellulales bacterium]
GTGVFFGEKGRDRGARSELLAGTSAWRDGSLKPKPPDGPLAPSLCPIRLTAANRATQRVEFSLHECALHATSPVVRLGNRRIGQQLASVFVAAVV